MNQQLPLDQLRNIRIEKLKKLLELQINPFVSKSNRTNEIFQITTSYDNFENKEVTFAGRITALRGHGELVFMDLEDFSGKIQVYIKHNEGLKEYSKYLKNIGFEELKLLDIGDFIEVNGVITKSLRGEISIQPKIIKLLTKSLRPMPSRHFGLKDEEERYRQRYVDFNLNKDLRDLFVKKSVFWDSIRLFMKKEGFLEVETPVLENTAGGADANPFVTHHNALDIDVYLRISMGELWQKRLMVAGFEKTFEIGRQFRNEGISKEHLQDYTQMEFYWGYANYEDSMKLVEEMYREVAFKTFGTYKFEINEFSVDFEKPFEKIDYKDTIFQNLQIDIEKANLEEIKSKLKDLRVPFEDTADKPRLIDLLWKQVRKKFAGPAFLINHPVEVSPLAKRKEQTPNFVERYQVILAGSEMGNGYSELNDPIDQLNRFKEQQSMRDSGDAEAQMADLDFVRALEYGMPPVTGFGVSERFFSFLANKSVRECVMFPLLRPEEFVASLPETTKIKDTVSVKVISHGSPKSSNSTILNKEKALEMLNNNVKNQNLVRHCLAVGYSLGAIYEYLKENNWKNDSPDNKEIWEVLGFLHDSDWELTKEDIEKHTLLLLEWLEKEGVEKSDAIYLAIQSHNNKKTYLKELETQMEWSLECVDELTGFIVAVALLKGKLLANVEGTSVIKRFKEKSFAAAVDRDQITQVTEKLGIPIEKFVEITLKAMQDNSKELGL